MGRYKNEKLEDRKCVFCTHDVVEDEIHVVTQCELYKCEREYMYNHIFMSNVEFGNLTNQEKFIILVNEYPRQLSKYLVKVYYKRRNNLYVCQ